MRDELRHRLDRSNPRRCPSPSQLEDRLEIGVVATLSRHIDQTAALARDPALEVVDHLPAFIRSARRVDIEHEELPSSIQSSDQDIMSGSSARPSKRVNDFWYLPRQRAWAPLASQHHRTLLRLIEDRLLVPLGAVGGHCRLSCRDLRAELEIRTFRDESINFTGTDGPGIQAENVEEHGSRWFLSCLLAARRVSGGQWRRTRLSSRHSPEVMGPRALPWPL